MKHLLPHLPYITSALEPHIDARTMKLHHGKHHASYVKALNLVMLSAPPALQDKSASWLLSHLNEVPENIRTEVRNSAGGHVNHSMLWKVMTPSGGVGALSIPLAKAIKHNFDSVEKFQDEFDEAGRTLFGNGWVWLIKSSDNNEKLEIMTTTGHDNPLSRGYVPLLLNDVWEHAYYLKYENQRSNYFRNWWPIVNWEEVSRRFDHSADPAEYHAEMIEKGNLEMFG